MLAVFLKQFMIELINMKTIQADRVANEVDRPINPCTTNGSKRCGVTIDPRTINGRYHTGGQAC